MASEIFNEATNGTPLSNCTNRRDHTAEILAFCWILVVSLTGNVLIGMIVFETKAWWTATNCLIVNMSVSDLLYLIFCFHHFLQWYAPVASVNRDRTSAWSFFYCGSSPLLFPSRALFNLTAVDRFVAVVFPLHSPFFSTNMCVMVIFFI